MEWYFAYCGSVLEPLPSVCEALGSMPISEEYTKMGILNHVSTWLELQGTVLSEMSQSQRIPCDCIFVSTECSQIHRDRKWLPGVRGRQLRSQFCNMQRDL